MNQDNLPIENLDFDLIKSNLKDYLRGQDKFKDYDFEGSGMNVILDLLAYNTHYQAFYANMVANEAFMDSSVVRSSAVSLAKHLGYTPRSVKASKATVDIDLGNNPNLITKVSTGTAFVLRGEPFIGKSDTGKAFNFTTKKNHKIEYIGGRCGVKNVDIHEGSYKTYSFVYNSFDAAQKFTLPSDKIDTDTIIVRVQKSVSDTEGMIDSWFRSTDITTLDADSNAFFIQETETGNFEIYFGDGIVGKSLQNGNVVIVEYLLTNSTAGNGCKIFTYMPTSLASNTVNVVVTVSADADGLQSSSSGGSLPESIDSIKYYSPRSYQAQERAVTVEDYSTLLSREFLERADSFFVWGGEENDPPQYGKVFISIKPKIGTTISTLEKLAIQKTILGKRNIISILPEVVDPDYLYLVLDLKIRFDATKATMSPSFIETLVRSKIEYYSINNLQRFGRNFRLSNFSTYIDSINPTISSNTVDMKLQKRFQPNLGNPSPYTLKFDTSLFHPVEGYPSILSSTSFGYNDTSVSTNSVVDAFLDEDGYGNIRIYKLVSGTKVYLINNIGSIDYNSGTIIFKNFNPKYINPKSETELRITVQPNIKDIEARRNQIVLIDNNLTTISIEQESYRIDKSESGSRFPF